jgi:hypothetical protein
MMTAMASKIQLSTLKAVNALSKPNTMTTAIPSTGHQPSH